MSKINEEAVWEPEIYQLTTEAAVLGYNANDGSNGPANVQAQQLANRTQFLREQVDTFSDLAKTGEIPFSSIDDAQRAIEAGRISLNQKFSFRTTEPNVWALEGQNINGIATPTGKVLPDGDAIAELSNTVQRFPDADVMVDLSNSVKTLQPQTRDAISFEDSLGRRAAAITSEGIFDIPHSNQKYIFFDAKDEDYVFSVEDAAGRKAFAVTSSGEILTSSGALTPEPQRPATMYINPNQFEGATQFERINNAISFLELRGGGILELATDTVSTPETNIWVVPSALLLPSGIELRLNHAKLKLADGVFDNIVRSKGIIVDPSNPYNIALRLDETNNIKITGSGIDSAFIEGPDFPYKAPHPILGGAPIEWIGDYFGWRTVGILLANTKNYELSGFTMRKTTCWAISQEHGCQNMHLHDINFDTTVKNGDGIDFRKGCSQGLVERITGSTSDDTIALTALLNFAESYPSGNYVFPMQVGGDADNPLGNDIYNIKINVTTSKSLHNQVRLLATGGSKMHGIYVDNTEDTGVIGATQVVVSTGGYGKPGVLGDMYNIFVNGIVSNFSTMPLRVSAPLKNARFNFIRQFNANGSLYTLDSNYPLVDVSVTNAKKV